MQKRNNNYRKEIDVYIAINNLVGYTGKYKEICKKLGEKPTHGNSKTKQIKEWESKFKLDKILTPQGRVSKYKILEVYDTPKVIEDNRGKNHSIYREDIEITLLYYLKSKLTPEHYLDFRMEELFKITGMVSKRYNKFKENKTLQEEAYYNNTYMFYKRNLETALSDLKKNRLNVLDVYKIKNKDGTYREATYTEYTDYNDTVVELLKKYKYKNISTVFFAGKQKQFFNELNMKLAKKNIKPIKKFKRIVFSKILIDFAIENIEAKKKAYHLNNNMKQGVIKSKSSYNPIYYNEEDLQNYFGEMPLMDRRKSFYVNREEITQTVEKEATVHNDDDFYVNYNKQ